MTQERGYSSLTIKAIDNEQRIIRGWATVPAADRVGDIVDPMGASFPEVVPLLWMHDHRLPVGSVKFGKPTRKGVPFEAKLPDILAPSQLKARIDEAWESVKNGLVRWVSIGFRALESSVIPSTGGLLFKKTEFYELSLVTVPANAGATIDEIKSLDKQVLAASGNTETAITQVTRSGVTDKTPAQKAKSYKTTNIKFKQRNDDMSLTKQAESLKAARAELQNQIVKMAEDAAETGQTFDEAQQEEYDAKVAEEAALAAQQERTEKAISMARITAKPVTEKDGLSEKGSLEARTPSYTVNKKENLEKGVEFARYVMALVKAKGDHSKALNIAKMHYGEDSRIARVLDAQAKGYDLISKAAVPAGSTLTGGSATWGAALVDFQDFTADFIEFLRPRTIIGRFGRDGIPALRAIPFNVTIKGQTSGATAGWVGEGKAKPVTSMGFNTVNLGFFKVAAIAVITDELVRFSDPNAERLVRDELARAVIERLDIDFINPNKAAVAGVSPASILNGVTGIASSGTDAAAIRCDLEALESAFIEANNEPDQAVFIMRPGTAQVIGRMQNALGQSEYPGINMRGGTLLGTPVITSNYVPAGVVALINAGDIYLADDGQVSVDASREASILMDTAPAMDSVTPADAELVSMYQTNSVAVRAERHINWARRRNSGVAYLTGVDYTSCVAVS